MSEGNITNIVIIQKMTGEELKIARSAHHWTQVEAAKHLGVTQAYLSMVERGSRPVSEELAETALKVYALPPTARPMGHGKLLGGGGFQSALGELGYPGFAYLRGGLQLNPAELLFLALDTEELDARVTEALPWIPFQFPEMDWEWLIVEVKLRDRQNRMAFVVQLAGAVAEAEGDSSRAGSLGSKVSKLERSRLAMEDTLCKASLSEAERRWLRSHRTKTAAHWNLLTDLKVEDLKHVYENTSS
ncbi:helix-turn-helix transcriptional regulator [Terriglobus albidus]|uniref:Helix-turn-helix transcriptional regulator n=1 Tax=Terriglobus albidus TaxID=1592106 RepID=A0A5B9EAY6_9BACT|nr:helix-turn-helix transcriptional regulator [Terriglobus albidus]QEE27830.1 helix-turn-helix transcriptional regulator [Terriglobus albidus]